MSLQNMKTPLSWQCILALIFISGCKEYAYYQSPLQANDHPYKTTPLQSDSLQSATYISGHFMAGGANNRMHDNLFNFNFDVHRGHNLGPNFQGWYGAQLTLGGYDANKYETNANSSNPGRAFDVTAVNATGGHKFFGAWGASGGLNVVVPFHRGGEWRIIGTELSYNHEFGDYLSFRQKLPAGAANGVNRDRYYWSMGYFTEIIAANPKTGLSGGYKLGLVTALKKLREDPVATSGNDFTPVYFAQTFHLTKDHITGYLSWNIGSYAMNVQMGANIRLGR
jgi:hypothetical protein